MLSEDVIKKLREQLFQGHYANHLENIFLQAWDIHTIKSTELEYLSGCRKAESDIAQINDKINELSEKKDKLSREQVKNLKNFILPTRTNMYVKFKEVRSDLYKAVVERADKIAEAEEKLSYRKNFDGVIPKLPFIEIEGTRYESTDTNDIKIDEHGNKVLYMKSNESADTNKKA